MSAIKKVPQKTGGSSSVPTSGTAYYSGKWESKGYPWFIAHGVVAAKVNYDTKSAQIIMRYDGAFRNGVVKRLETQMDAKSNAEGAVATSQATMHVFTVKGVGVQNLTFQAHTITAQNIKGNYDSQRPQDTGTFEMTSITADQFAEFSKNPNSHPGCLIM